MVKPFLPRELVARVRAILRRVRGSRAPRARRGRARATSWWTRAGARCARPQGWWSSTAREFDLLAYLASNRGLVLSRRRLLDGVWGEGWYGDERTVDVHVRQLRKKLGDDLALATVWGVGYRLD